jgi:hypothetical protein
MGLEERVDVGRLLDLQCQRRARPVRDAGGDEEAGLVLLIQTG